MSDDSQAVLDSEGPGKDRDDPWWGEQPEPKGGDEWRYEVDDSIGEPSLPS